MVQAAEHGQARTLVGAVDAFAHARVAPDAKRVATRGAHYFLPPVLPALPSLRRTYSPSCRMPLPLYGSGGRMPRICAASWPTACLSAPETVILVVPSTAMVS